MAQSGPCSIEGCVFPTPRFIVREGWGLLCPTHYQRARDGRAMTTEYMSKPGRRTRKSECSVEGCTGGAPISRGFCQMHYNRWKRWGDPLHVTVPRRYAGESHSKWKGGRSVSAQGYVTVWTPDRGHVHEHRLVMERIEGRRLHPWETVHHKNGVRDDNRPENLELWMRPQPAGQRVADVVNAYLPLSEPELCMVMC